MIKHSLYMHLKVYEIHYHKNKQENSPNLKFLAQLGLLTLTLHYHQ